MKYIELSRADFDCDKKPHLKFISKCWKTFDNKYFILYENIKGIKHLRILRADNQPIHSFMDMQEIKNDLLGADCVAVEIYPKQSDFINGTDGKVSNVYHIWTWDGIDVPNLKYLYE